MLLFASVFASLPAAGTEQLLIGDVNSDGRVDRNDAGLLYQVLYASKIVPKGRIPSMDMNGDGIVDLDDLLMLREMVSSGRAPKYRMPPTVTPAVIPRRADLNWWIKPENKVMHNLSLQVHGLQSRDHSLMPSKSFIQGVDLFLRDLNQAIHFGLSEEHASEFCDGIFTFSKVAVPQVESWLRAEPLGRRYIEACASKMTKGPHWLSGINIDSSCDTHFKNRYKFSVSPKVGGLVVRMPLRIEFDPSVSSDDISKFSKRWKLATECVSAFWSRYGVDFSFDVSEEAALMAEAYFKVVPGTERGNASKLAVNGFYFKNLCSWAVHEFGHWMGLTDDYDEPGERCTGRHPDDLGSIMGVAASLSILHGEWRPRHIEKIFGKLCGPFRM